MLVTLLQWNAEWSSSHWDGDAGLAKLGDLTGLTRLVVASTDVNDAAIASWGSLERLRELCLDSCSYITDRCELELLCGTSEHTLVWPQNCFVLGVFFPNGGE